MFIPIGQRTTATIKGEAVKTCTCEACRTEYVYTMESTVQGHGATLLFMDIDAARDRATSSAEKKLQKALEEHVVPVACPRCGWFQANMVVVDKKAQFSRGCKWSLLLGAGLLAVAIFLSINAWKGANLFKWSGLFFLVASPLLGLVFRLLHNSNAGHPGIGLICRERAEQSVGTTKKEYEAMLRANQAAAGNNPSR